MLEPQREGIAKAKGEGKYKGRAPTVAKQAERIRTMHAGWAKPTHIAKQLGVARSSVYRMLDNPPAAVPERAASDLTPAFPQRGAAV